MTTEVLLPEFVRDLLSDLRVRFGLDAWALTRTVETDAMVIFSVGDERLAEGSSHPLPGSLLAAVAERGTVVAGDVTASGPQGAAPLDEAAAFVGAAVETAGGPFGVVFGVGATPTELDTVEVRLALSVAARALRLALDSGQAATPATGPPVVRGDVRRDALTGLLNDRGWQESLKVEEERSRRYGNHGTVLRLRIRGLAGEASADGPGEVVLRQAGEALRAWRRGADVVARIGDADFAVLLVEAWEDDAAAAITRLRQTFEARRIDATLGVADNASQSLIEAAEVARAQMVAGGGAS